MPDAVTRQIELILKQLGWDWSNPRVVGWMSRAGFSSSDQLTDKAKIALAQYLGEVLEVAKLQAQHKLGGTYAAQWFINQGFTDGLAPMRAWVALRRHLEALEEDIPF